MFKIVLEFTVLILAFGKILDFYLKDKTISKHYIAYRFLEMEDWLIKNEWRKIQVKLIHLVYKLHCKLFGNKIISFRYLASIVGISIGLTICALLLSMYLISPSELLSAGFNNPFTPYTETLNELYIESANKTQTIIPTIAINLIFDFIAVTISYMIIRSLQKKGGVIKTISLTSTDILLSLLFVALIQVSMVVFQMSGYMFNMLQGRPTTFLMSSSTTLTLVSCTVVFPVIFYSLTLSFIGFVRLSFKSLAFLTNRLADESKTIFTDMAVFISSIIVFSVSLGKIFLFMIEAFISLLLSYEDNTKAGILGGFFVFWLKLF